MPHPTTSPWLSVLVPVYNVREYLEACVQSVLGDPSHGVELLLLDDCSTDGSLDLAEAIAAAHTHRVRLLRHDRNRGLSAARNNLLAEARGDYIWFLDSDDLLMPGAISALRNLLADVQPDLVLCDFRTLRDNFSFKHRLRGELHRRTLEGASMVPRADIDPLLTALFAQGHLHSWSKIARRTLWADELRFPEGHYFEDIATTPILAARARSFVYADRVWVGYRQRADSILATATARKVDDMMAALQSLPMALRSLPAAPSPEVRFHASYFAARTFVSACRFEARHGFDPERRARHLAAFTASSPMAPDELVSACWQRGWLWRAQRLQHWTGRMRR